MSKNKYLPKSPNYPKLKGMKRFTKTQLTNTIMKVLRATFEGPVVITDRGSDSHVLMTIEDYELLLGEKDSKKADL